MPWVLEFDIRGLFDNIPHHLLIKALEHHHVDSWVIMYVKRWLTAPIQMEDGRKVPRNMGTPQGGVCVTSAGQFIYALCI